MNGHLLERLVAILDPDASNIDNNDFPRRSSRSRKVPTRLIHEIQIKSSQKPPPKTSMSPRLPTVPSKRTGDCSDQAGGKVEGQYLSDSVNVESASSAHQPVHRKRAKKTKAAGDCGVTVECKNQDQRQEGPRVSGGSEGAFVGEMSVVASPSDDQNLSAAKQAQEDGLLAAVYDL